MSGPPDGEPTATPDPASGQASDLPWRPGELQRVLGAVPDLTATLSPAPVAAPSIATRLGEGFSG